MNRNILTFALLTMTAACGSASNNEAQLIAQCNDVTVQGAGGEFILDINVQEIAGNKVYDITVNGESFTETKNDKTSYEPNQVQVQTKAGVWVDITLYPASIGVKLSASTNPKVATYSLTNGCEFPSN